MTAPAIQEARVAGKVLTASLEAWGSSRRCRLVEGRTGVGLIARWSGAAPRVWSVVEGGEVAGHARVIGEHLEMHKEQVNKTA